MDNPIHIFNCLIERPRLPIQRLISAQTPRRRKIKSDTNLHDIRHFHEFELALLHITVKESLQRFCLGKRAHSSADCVPFGEEGLKSPRADVPVRPSQKDFGVGIKDAHRSTYFNEAVWGEDVL